MTRLFKLLAKTAFISVLIFSTSFAQEIGVGADFVSRYIWRGLDFGNSPSIQPYLSYSNSGFEIGAWGAYQTGRDGASQPADELDLYAGYTFGFSNGGSLGLIVTDYYFPYPGGTKFGNYSDPGNHTLEVGASYTVSESVPLSLSAYFNVYNDDDNTSYFEVGYSTSLNDVGVDFAVGATPGGDLGYYVTDKFNVINLSITASKEIKITDDFSLPIFGSYILNPNTEIAHFVFGISL